jgi:hypothetical protein
MKKGRAGTMTHDYKRNGTTRLFAAMNVLDGTVIGHKMQRHRHQEFIRFLNAVERDPAGKTIHAVLDNYAAHKHPLVRRWLARHQRWTFHFTPTSASLAQRQRGLFRHSDQASSQAWRLPIRRRPTGRHQPLRWPQRPLKALPMARRPDKIIAARAHQALDSIH